MIRIFIATEIRLYRELLAEVLGQCRDLAVVGSSGSGAETREQVAALDPGVVLLDLAIPGALRTVRELAADCPRARVLVLAVPESEDEILACAEAGASGFVEREASLEQLVAALRKTARGELRCSARTAALLMRRVGDLAASRRHASVRKLHLTPRQREILELIDQGLSNKEIAGRLYIEVSTVKNHVHNILEKLEVGRRAQAAAVLRSADAR